VAIRATWHGTTYAFCCEVCKQAFAEDPARFVGADVD
jgi:YHS domain-containing protein